MNMDVPRELRVLIMNYVNRSELIDLIIIFDIELTPSEYITMIRTRFPLYYRKEITRWNIQQIYMSLLEISEIIIEARPHFDR